MDMILKRCDTTDAARIHQMQVRAFWPLFEKYGDTQTSPACESVERVAARLQQPVTDYYFIQAGKEVVGAIRIVRMENATNRISPVFILPEYQGKGLAQRAFARVEEMYPEARWWELDTIMQERGNCHLYEKLGYRQTGQPRAINDRMTIVYYQKQMGETKSGPPSP